MLYSENKCNHRSYLFLCIFLLTLRVIPDLPLVVKVLYDLGSKLDVLFDGLLVASDPVDRPYTLLQLPVQSGTQVTVT